MSRTLGTVGALARRAVIPLLGLAAGCRATVEPPRAGDEPTLALHGPQGILCGAVAIAPNLAVTAAHCAPGRIVRYTTIEKSGKPSRSGTGFVVRRDAGSDLAAFTASGLVPAELSRSAPDVSRATELVAHAPHPWTVSAIRMVAFDEGFLHTERLAVGASGCGLWNDAGELIGIAIGNDRSSGYFATIPRISRMLRGTIEVSIEPTAKEEPTDRDPAIWHDQHLRVEALLAGAREHQQRLDAEIRAYEQEQRR